MPSLPVSRRQITQEPKATMTNAIATSIPPLTGPSGFRIKKYTMIHTPRTSDMTPMKVNGKRTALDHRSKVGAGPRSPGAGAGRQEAWRA